MHFDPCTCPECGQLARGVIERIPGVALLQFDEDGRGQYAGGTDVWWDDQIADRDEQDRVTLICPDGHLWPATGGRAANQFELPLGGH